MTVVIGYFGGPEGKAALHHGAMEAQNHGQRLVVVDATPTTGSDSDALRQLDHGGIEYQLHEARLPDPAENVLQAAQEHSASLIVIGLRHRSPVGKLLLGSHAQRVLLEADVPVLAVKSPPSATTG
ncbi:universal stress protein family protein [Kribbella sp. VKM Ac-2527]|uniref:Universal stress protein family protein n=1 Tax=Kribbella caucasensis TaxID=2512215 RepID=A0A4R6J5D0_9ACTN|nr:universal stress protein [Kribbella sp. VKM Ac-2527]TDO30237.1 universal stress protein family protein [Kribbella sp. VKM Ac-2527]